jgi:hypothetical protein
LLETTLLSVRKLCTPALISFNSFSVREIAFPDSTSLALANNSAHVLQPSSTLKGLQASFYEDCCQKDHQDYLKMKKFSEE